MNKIKVAIAGLGGRGRNTFGQMALDNPDMVEVVAVSDIDDVKLKEAAKVFNVPEERCFGDVADLLKKERLADVLFVCTPDKNHYKTAIDALKLGYHLLLEKPAATEADECKDIAKTANETNRHVVVCHVLRYTPFYSKINEKISSGEIGDFVTLNAVEGVGYYHHAHSFVRGNWSNTKETSPMILAKCCHDVDMILWLTGKHVSSISSFGSLQYFKPEKAPEGSAKRCTECSVKKDCPYDAEKIYLTSPVTGVNKGSIHWPADVLAKPATKENIENAVKNGPYGRCVFHCDNDAVDHQVVNMEFSDRTTAHLTMTAFSEEIYRTIQVMGTLGIIEGDTRTNIIKVSVFGGDEKIYDMAKLSKGGHGGGDSLLFKSLIDLLSGKNNSTLTSIDDSIESHVVCLAAEASRLDGGKPVVL